MGVSAKEASKTDWHYTANQNGYIGHELTQLGCLMRIADATELMAKSHTRLIEERDRYERKYVDEVKANEYLLKRIAALKGAITKMKTKK